jgi:hypothetical protein
VSTFLNLHSKSKAISDELSCFSKVSAIKVVAAVSIDVISLLNSFYRSSQSFS